MVSLHFLTFCRGEMTEKYFDVLCNPKRNTTRETTETLSLVQSRYSVDHGR